MYLIVFLQGFVFYGSIATLYRLERGISLSEIFIIESVLWILIILLEIPWGWLADRIGYKKILILSNLLFFISKIIFYKADSFNLFLLEKVISAMSLSGLSGCDTAFLYLSVDKDENRGKVFSSYEFFSNSGFLLASLISPFIIGISMGSAAFYTIFPYGLAFIATCFLVDLNKENFEKTNIKSSFKIVLKNKRFLIYIASFGLITEVVHSVTVFLNQGQYIKSGIDIRYFGLILALVQVVKLASGKSYKFRNLFGENKSISVLAVIITIGCGSLVFTNTPILSVFIIGMISVAMAVMQPIITEIKNKSISIGDRATILSIYSMLSSIIATIINPIIGYSSEVSIEAGFITCFIIGIVGCLILNKYNKV